MDNFLTFNGCNISTLKIKEYEFYNYNELLVLTTLKKLSDCSKVIKRSFSGETYFWFNQRTFLDRPEVSMSIRTLQNITCRLEKLGFLTRHVERSVKGTYSFFRIIDAKFNELVIHIESSVVETTADDEEHAQDPTEACEKICVPKEKLNKPFNNKSYSYKSINDKAKEKENYTYQDFSNQIELNQDELTTDPLKEKCIEVIKHYIFTKNNSYKYYVNGQEICHKDIIGLLKSLKKEHFNQVIEYMKSVNLKSSFAATLYTALFKAHSMCLVKNVSVPVANYYGKKVNKFNEFPQRIRSNAEWNDLERELLAVSYSF